MMKSSTLFVSMFLLILNSSNANIECDMDTVQGDISDWIFGLSDDVGCGAGTRGATTYRCTASSPDGGSELTIAFESSNLEKEPQSITFYSSNMAGYHDTHNFVDPCNAVAELIEFYDTACLACEDFNPPPPANSCNMDDVQAEIKPWVLTKGVDGCGAGTRQATSYTCLNDGYYDENRDGALLKVDFVSSNLEKVPQTMDFYYENGDDVRHNTHTFEEPCNAIAELSSFFDNDCYACDGFMTDAQCDAMAVHEKIRSFMNVQGFQCQDEDASNYSCNPETTLSDGTTKVAKRPDGSTFELSVMSNADGSPMGIDLYHIGGRGGASHRPQAFDDPCNATKEVEDFVQAMYDEFGMGEDEFAEDPPPANSCNMDDVQAEIKPWVLTKGVDGCGAGTRQATSYTCSGAMSKVVFESSNLEKVPQTMDFYYENGNDVRHNTHTFEEPCNAIAELSSFFDNDCYACDGFMTDAQCDAMAVHEKIRSFMNVQGFQCQDEDASNYSCNPETTLSDGTTKVAKRPDGSTFELSVTSNADGSPLRIGLNYIGGRGGASGEGRDFEDPCQALVEVEDFVQAMYEEYGMGEDEFAKPSNDEDIPVDDAAFPIYDCTWMDFACQTAYNTALYNWKAALGETWTTDFNKCAAHTPYSTEAISCYMAMNTSWFKESTSSTVEDTDVTTKSPEADISALSKGDEESSSSSLSALMTKHLMTRIAAISVVTAVIVSV